MIGNRNRRSWFICTGLLLMAVMALSGCGTATKTEDSSGKGENTPAQQTPAGKKLVMAYTWKPSGVDPHGDNSWDVMRSGAGETLIRLNEKLEPVAWLAKEWKHDSPNVWTFSLQGKVTFHDGKSMDAASVKASLLRSIEKSHLAKDLLDVKSIDVNGPLTLKITTNQPNAALASNLADPSTIVLDVASMKDEQSYPAMTGAFKIKAFNKDQSLVVERYDGYWGEKARLAEATMKFITDGNSRLMALQSGEVDVATDIPVDNAEVLKKNDKLQVLSAPSLRTHMIVYNMESSVFKDATNRKVVDSLIPRASIVSAVMRGYGTEASSPFPSILPFGKIERKALNGTAEQLLTKDGWQKDAQGTWSKQGKPFEVTLLTFPQRPELSVMAEVIQSQLLNEGIQVKIRKVENIDEALTKNDWDFAMYSMLTAHTGEPQYFMDMFYSSTSEANVSRYASKPLEDILHSLKLAKDTTQRNAVTLQALDIINTDLPQSFIVHPDNVFGVKKGVEGFTPHPIEYYYITAQSDIAE
ncbi:ABC transporter substrate-binding protein [Paenibacillus polymyxa]|uniref:ABC transporter substrate-binding protein n=1 Tax=Paenibacillus polymyxa TaxID=1406 RepID=UPI002ED12739|nr:ABC transporter substrate-binding protein [Paenibacillus polymyxa]